MGSSTTVGTMANEKGNDNSFSNIDENFRNSCNVDDLYNVIDNFGSNFEGGVVGSDADDGSSSNSNSGDIDDGDGGRKR